MRNLKRALSLALASVMLVGMMVVGSSAASFPDVEGDHNTEAIAVLNAVEVMIGNEKGEFEPDKNVTRNEMAVILAKLILGKDADRYVGTCPFTDVPEWAQKYVAACYDNKIVAGRGEGIYDGSAIVTAQEAAAMTLRVLGYEKLEAQGTNWAQPVVAKANEIRLFKDVGSSAIAPLNRNQVAQLALNALKADVVTTTSGSNINLGDIGTITTDVKYDLVLEGEFNYNSAVTDSHDELYRQLCEKLYEDDLQLNTTGSDSFGRNADKWEYNDEDVITVAQSADRTYVGAVEAGDIYKDLNLKETVDADEISYYEDTDTSADGAYAIADKSSDEYGADGQVVYVYYDKDAAKPVTICVISSYLGVVVDDDYTKDGKDGVLINVFGEGDRFFESTGYKEDDVLLLNLSDGEIEDVVGVPETVSGSVTRKGTDGALTIDGTKYAQALQFDAAGDGDVVDGIALSSVKISNDNTYVLYLDGNDCYLAVTEDVDNTTTDLVYVYSVEAGSALKGNKVEYGIYAKVVLMDGTVKEVLMKDTTQNTPYTSSDVSSWMGTKSITENTLMDLEYDKDEDEYELAASADYTSTNIAGVAVTGTELKTDSKYAKLDGTNNYNLDEDTVYLFVAENDGHDDIDDVERVVGGVDYDIAAGAMTGSVFAKDSKNNADYVVFLDEYTASNKDVLYIKSAEVKGRVDGGFLFEGYYAGSDEKVEIPVYSVGGSTTTEGANKPTANKFYEYSEKSDGTLKLSTALTSSDGAYESATLASISSRNMIDIGQADMYDATGVKVIDLTDVDETDKTQTDYNAYGRAITSLSTLKRVVENANYGDVTVDTYVNGDDEVTMLIVRKVAAGPHTHNNWSAWEVDAEDSTKHVRTCQVAGCDEKEEHTIDWGAGWDVDAQDSTKHSRACEGTDCDVTEEHTINLVPDTDNAGSHKCDGAADCNAGDDTCTPGNWTEALANNAAGVNVGEHYKPCTECEGLTGSAHAADWSNGTNSGDKCAGDNGNCTITHS